MFKFFDSLVDSTALPPAEPPSGLLSFYWHFVRQAKGLFAALFLIGFTLAIVEAVVPYLIGRLVSVLSSVPREQVFETAGHLLLVKAGIILHISRHKTTGEKQTLPGTEKERRCTPDDRRGPLRAFPAGRPR